MAPSAQQEQPVLNSCLFGAERPSGCGACSCNFFFFAMLALSSKSCMIEHWCMLVTVSMEWQWSSESLPVLQECATMVFPARGRR